MQRREENLKNKVNLLTVDVCEVLVKDQKNENETS